MYSKISRSETTLGGLETEVKELKRQVERLEEEEMRLSHENNEGARKKQQLEESDRREMACSAEEQNQLDKLMMDLGISSPDRTKPQVRVMSNPQLVTSDLETGENNSLEFDPFAPIDSSAEPVCTTNVSQAENVEDVSKIDVDDHVSKTSKTRAAGKKTNTEEKTPAVKKDPFASLGDVVTLKRDLKISDGITDSKTGSKSEMRTVDNSSSRTVRNKRSNSRSNVQSAVGAASNLCNGDSESNSDNENNSNKHHFQRQTRRNFSETQPVLSSSPQF